MDLMAIEMFVQLVICFGRQKKKGLVCGALVFLVYRYSTLHREEPADKGETDLKQSQAELKCEYRIPGIGTLYLDEPVDAESECTQRKSSKVRRDVVTGNNRVSSILRTPLEVHEFPHKNISISSKDFHSIYLPVNGQRILPDLRTDLCRSQGMYIKRLPRASIIVPMHNVAWSVLIRMVHSVINTTPIELLEEIIIVDDASDMEYLKTGLDSYFKTVKKVKILRIPERVGFFQARNKGADLASAPVLIFLYANTECSPGWVEPLLERIAVNRSIIASPSMDIIDQDTGKYNLVLPESVGGFSWNLMFSWKGLTDKDMQGSNLAQPLKTPNLPGGNFAVDKKFFSILGQHDPVMDTLEFDNLELSIKCWLCGGSLEIVPCSHIGQVEYSYEPDNMAGYRDMILNISIRAAEVWFEEYKSYFHDRVGEPSIDIGDRICGRI
jgi:glycosyltransferase involved in cell wall biosynthesis